MSFEEEEVEPGRMLVSMRRKLAVSVAVYASAALMLGALAGPGFLPGSPNQTGGDEGSSSAGPFAQVTTLGSLRSVYYPVATYSPAADRVAATDSSGVRIWDARKGRILLNISTSLAAWDHVWSPTGDHIAVFAAESSAYLLGLKGVILIFETLSGRQVVRIEDVILPQRRGVLSWSPDGERICVIRSDGPAIYDLGAGSFSLVLDSNASANSVKWSPSGDMIAVSFDKGLYLFDPRDGSLRNQFLVEGFGDYTDMLFPYAFSLDGGRVAVAGNTKPVIQIFDVYTGDLLRSVEYAPLVGMVAGLCEIAWSSSDRIAVVPGWILPEDTVGIYDYGSGLITYASESYYEGRGLYSTPEVEWSRDGSKLAVSGDLSGFVSIWSSGGELLSRWRAAESSVHASWAPSGDLLCLAADTIVISDIQGREMVNFVGYMGPIRSISWDIDGDSIASAGETLRIWSAQDGHQIDALTDNNQTATLVDWHPSGLVAAYVRPSDYDVSDVSENVAAQKITLYDPLTGAVVNRLDRDAKYGYAMDIGYSPDGSLIASCWNTGEVAVRDVEEGRKLWGTVMRETAEATDLAWHPNGSRLAVIRNRRDNGRPVEGLLEIYDPLNGSRTGTLTLRGWPSDVAWSDDGRLIAISMRYLTGSEDVLAIIDAEALQLVTNVTGPEAYSVVWNPDGSVMTGHGDGVRIWDPLTGKMIGFHGGVGGAILEWSPDRTVLAASASDTIGFWHAQQILLDSVIGIPSR